MRCGSFGGSKKVEPAEAIPPETIPGAASTWPLRASSNHGEARTGGSPRSSPPLRSLAPARAGTS